MRETGSQGGGDVRGEVEQATEGPQGGVLQVVQREFVAEELCEFQNLVRVHVATLATLSMRGVH